MFGYLLGETLRRQGGKIYIRCDDTNKDKGDNEQFHWFYQFTQTLGMKFDALPGASRIPIYQSERTTIYDEKLTELLDRGLALRKANSQAVLFDVKRYVDAYGENFICEDLVLGKMNINARTLLQNGQSEFPLRRSDGHYVYHLTAPVDDGEMGITHVTKGRDKLSSLIYHEAVKRSLGYPECKYFHLPLLLNKDGSLLKGNEYLIPGMIDRGCPAQVILSYLFSSCHAHAENLFDFASMKAVFDPKRVSRSNGHYDAPKLKSIERKYIANCTPEESRALLQRYISASDPELAVDLEKYPRLLQLFTQHRMQMPRVLRVARALLNPVYDIENLSPSFKASALEAITSLRLEKSEFGQKDLSYHNVIRWVLTGKEEGIPSDATVGFLRESNLLEHRLSMVSARLGLSV